MPKPITLIQPPVSSVVAMLVIAWISIAWIRKYFKLRRSNPAGLPYPPGPKGLPFVGSLLEMHTDQEWLTYDNWSHLYGDLVFINAAGVNMLYLNSPEAVHDLLDKQAGIYSDRPNVPMVDLIGWGFNFGIMRYGEKWRAHSRIFHQYFHIRNTPDYYPDLVRSATLLLKELATNSTNVIKNVRNSTGAFIMSVAYGHDIAPNSSDSYVELARLAMEGFGAVANPGSFYVDMFPSLMYVPEWMMPKWAFKKKASLWRPHAINFKERPYAMVRERMAAGTAKSCVATRMVQDHLDGVPAASERYANIEDIIKNCIGIAYAGGSDTTVSSLSSFFLAMMLYPHVQRRAQEELDNVLTPGAMPTFEDRPQLPYIEAVTREVLRWHPVLPQGVVHRAMADNVYRGYFIPEGTLLVENTWTILHDKKTYPDEPIAFKPERFLNKNLQIDKNVFNPSKVTFGAGRRICPGRHVADANIWITIAFVLRTFNITKAKDRDGKEIMPNVRFTNGLISHPEPFDCSVKPRSPEYEALVQGLELRET